MLPFSLSRLEELLSRFAGIKIAVAGDFFLDRYYLIDAELDEPSVETNLTAYQVVEQRFSPGAAGTVAANLSALGIEKIFAVGFTGNDGEGFELRRQLHLRNICTDFLAEDSERITPCYTKPMRNGKELNRIDIKNRRRTSTSVERHIIDTVGKLLPEVDAVMIMDQVSEPDCGAITTAVRNNLSELSAAQDKKLFYADSRENIGIFRNMIIKCNEREATETFGIYEGKSLPQEMLKQSGIKLSERNGKPVFITLGENGQLVIDGSNADGNKAVYVPAVKVDGEIDFCGAGDAASAALVSALCAGASLKEAAFIGNLAASVTIQKLGQTGTASADEIIQAYNRYFL
ncbi:ADP-heptose synthase [Planctomycetales bacterium]|nr:ADP-heptose synthase [Planctomycetales bacterium]GHT36596.1 ADP-heptose synthase [Planctomycetales bacterium]